MNDIEDIRRSLDALLEKFKGVQVVNFAPNGFNIFSILGIENNEVLICRVLAALLNPRGIMGQRPLKMFFEEVLCTDVPDSLDDCIIDLERVIDGQRRVDIVIDTHKKVFPIEVKVWATDQKAQLYDYYQYFRANNSLTALGQIYYLTPNGTAPTDASIRSASDKSAFLAVEQYQCISFSSKADRHSVLEWLRNLASYVEKNIDESRRKDIDNYIAILRQFEEVLEYMTKNISSEVCQLLFECENNDDGISKYDNLLNILYANENIVLDTYRRKYVEKLIGDLTNTNYELVFSDESERQYDGYVVCKVIRKNGDNRETIAAIIVSSNLYIGVMDGYALTKNGDNTDWQYLHRNNSTKKINLKHPWDNTPALSSQDRCMDIVNIFDSIVNKG